MIDLSLFRSASFTWGVILAATAVLAMIGVIFTMPQYFQGVQGADAMGSGVRLLPLIGGLVVGAVPADRLARLLGAKITVALGFVVLAGGCCSAPQPTSASSVRLRRGVDGHRRRRAWASPWRPRPSAALSELSPERSGVGSAVMQALQKVGGPFGAAILGSVLSSAYQRTISPWPGCRRPRRGP